MSKLQNIKAVKEMMAGTHKTQTRKTFAMGSTKKELSEEDIEERFEDGSPKVWIETDPISGARTRVTQHNGFKSREPDKCPECGKDMHSHEKRLNHKFYFKRGKCFDCVLKEERAIKNQGEEAWKEYENKIMLSNAEGWFKDADKEVEILKTQVMETYWQNAQGEVGQIDVTEFVEKMEKDYLELKNHIRNQYS